MSLENKIPPYPPTFFLFFFSEFLKHENIEPPQSMWVSKNLEDVFSPGEKQPENSEVTVAFKEKEPLDSGASETCMDKKTSYREMALSSRETRKDYNTPNVTSPHLVENIDCEVPATTDYLQDRQRSEEPDDSLYLGQEEYLELVLCSEDEETTVEEEDYNDPEHLVYDGEEDSECSETMEFYDEEESYEDSETGMSLEEEEEKSMEGMEMIHDQ